MKQAKVYESKIKKLLKDAPKSAKVEDKDADPITVLIQSILEANADDQQAVDAYEAILNEFVDYNELRVAPIKDIVECLDQGIDEPYPKARAKAEMLRESLGHLFNNFERITMEHLEKANKKEQRQLLSEMHLNEYAVGKILLRKYARHAVPVDDDLLEVLVMDDLVHPETDIVDTQMFLERVIAQKDVEAAYVFLRGYVKKRFKDLQAKRDKEAKERRKVEQAEAKAKAKAEEKKRQEQAAKEEAAAKAERKKSEKKSKKSVRKKTATKGDKKLSRKKARKKKK